MEGNGGSVKEKLGEGFRNHIYILRIAFQHSKSYFCIFFLLIMVTNIKDLVLVIAPKYIFDGMQFGGSFEAILIPVVIYVTLYLCLHLMIHGLEFGKNVLEAKLKMQMNVELGEKFMKVDYHLLEEHSTFEMFQQAKIAVSGGLSDLQMQGLSEKQGITGYFEQLAKLIKDIILLCSVLYVLTYLEPTLILLILFCIGLSMIFSTIQVKANVAVRREAAPYHAKSRYCKRLLRSFEFGKEFRVFDLTDFFVSRFESCTREFLKVRDFYQRRCWFASVMSYVVNNGLRLLVLIGLIMKLRMGGITVGDFAMVFAAILTFSDTSQDLLRAILTLNIFTTFMSDYRRCMQMKEEKETEEPEVLADIREIRFRNVWYSYSDTKEGNYALKDINLVIHPNEKISIVGFNGAGKTTFIKLLLGVYEPTRGEILINGKNRKEYSKDNLKRYMSAVFQDFIIYALSVEENIAMGEAINEMLLKESMHRGGIQSKISSLTRKEKSVIGGFFEEDDLLLSGGESQKIAMARCFYRNTPIIALDEPTSALDVLSEDRMYKDVLEQAKEECILFISHRLASSRFCERILVFDSGEIIEDGTHEQLLGLKGCYYEMWRVQAEKFR